MNPRRTARLSSPTRIGVFLGILTLAAATSSAAEAKPEGIPSRDAILRRMETIFGPLPGPERRVTLDPEVLSEADCGTFVRRDITYRSEPGSRVPAFLLIPKTALRSGTPLRHPAALALHQTHAAGRRVVVGLGNSPDDEYGVELAQRGWVVLAPAYPQLADYAPDILGLGHASGSMKAVWDNLRGLDLLASLPFVRTNGFASIGHSLGGHNGLFTAAFDSRIRVVVTSCGFDSFRDYRGANPDLWRAGQGWCQVRYMPRLAAYQNRLDQIPFDFSDVLAAIAPRRVFVNAPTGDTNFKWDSVDRVVRTATGIAQVSGEWVTVRHPEAPHQFPSALRQEAYQLLEEIIGKAQ